MTLATRHVPIKIKCVKSPGNIQQLKLMNYDKFNLYKYSTTRHVSIKIKGVITGECTKAQVNELLIQYLLLLEY